jgi:hypothetical protein
MSEFRSETVIDILLVEDNPAETGALCEILAETSPDCFKVVQATQFGEAMALLD